MRGYSKTFYGPSDCLRSTFPNTAFRASDRDRLLVVFSCPDVALNLLLERSFFIDSEIFPTSTFRDHFPTSLVDLKYSGCGNIDKRSLVEPLFSTRGCATRLGKY